MATDGTKIIDGDTSHDTYWGIMDLYDSGADLKIILTEYPLEQKDYSDDFDNEIYVTSCGLAYWEIGLMTMEIIIYIENVIKKNACVENWYKLSEQEGRARKNALKRFFKKISNENTKIRKPKKFRKITNFLFDENDILTFKVDDNSYRVLICIKIHQYRGNCNYWFVPTTYNSLVKPTKDLIINEMILGGTIGTRDDKETIRQQQPGIDVIWDYVGGNRKFFFGFIVDAVMHKDLIKFKNLFEKVGSIKIIEGLKENSTLWYSGDFKSFNNMYFDLNNLKYKKYPLKIMIEK